MNPEEQTPNSDESVAELEMDVIASVDDFIKELEAKEKDLHITADLTIEIEESDFHPDVIPEFVQQELPQRPKVGAPAPDAVPIAEGGLKTRVFELQNELESLRDKMASLRLERNEVQEKSDRRLKDFESYKYRMDRERRGSFIDQISNLASQMLPVLDNLSRALDSTEKIEAERSPDFEQFHDGIVLVNHQLSEVLAGMGVQPIESVGERFDPHFHEAVAIEQHDDLPANTILEEMLRGYRIGNRVIRHSMVKVTTAPPSAQSPTLGTDTNEAVWLDPDEDPANEISSGTDLSQPDVSTPEAD